MLVEQKNLVVTDELFESYTLMLGAGIKQSDWVPDSVIGIGRGGWKVAAALSRILHIPSGSYMCKSYEEEGSCIGVKLKAADGVCFIGQLKGRVLVVDDLVEKGITLKHTHDFIKTANKMVEVRTAVLFRKSETQYEPHYFVMDVEHDRWIFFRDEMFERLDIRDLSQELLLKLSKSPELASKILQNLPLNPREKLSTDEVKLLIDQ